jgi:kexin
MLKNLMTTPYIRVLLILVLLVPGCIRENPIDPKSIDNSNPDPLYTDQWHLNNTGQGGGTAGEDINVEPVWNDGNYGSGVYIAIVDDGLDMYHEDLYANVVKGLNYNYVTGYSTVNPGEHGTSVAGVAAAMNNNPYGGRGAAPDANIFNYNLLNAFTYANQQDAMVRNKDLVYVSNNSWGPSDCYGDFDASPALWKAGIDEGITTGRGGKGIVYTWAGGNGGGGGCPDNSNYDGYANYYGVVAVAAVNNSGTQSCYSEPGANIWISAYSNDPSSCSGTGLGITTTDIMGSMGYDTDNYTSTFGGTSSAAPLAAGAIALVLSANQDLTWRDVKIILARTAKTNSDTGWVINGATENGGGGYNINYKYGFGIIDADAAVDLAETWTNVGSMVTYSTPLKIPGTTSIDNNTINDNIIVSSSGITTIEYVAIDITIEYSDAGDLDITLTSPDGTDSILTESHSCYDSYGGSTTCTYFNITGGNTFTFGSARHLGEIANGTWSIAVTDTTAFTTGTFVDWSLTFYGR